MTFRVVVSCVVFETSGCKETMSAGSDSCVRCLEGFEETFTWSPGGGSPWGMWALTCNYRVWRVVERAGTCALLPSDVGMKVSTGLIEKRAVEAEPCVYSLKWMIS